ncbi:TSUP family transporter [Haemophilus sputorum]|uniref:TSUP family transporter n=1 Tax=Haemophilus sputorum TaxID=1078480 RepID=UPI0028D87769|nr:TSUP family transporter [Haemophilus sputorum]
MEISIELLALLFSVATFAGFIDAIAGGGGLLTIPALLATGMPPAIALGTNKLQACGGSFSASLYFVRKKAVNLREILLLIALTFLGAAIGSILIQRIDVQALKVFLPFLVFAIGLYFLFAPSIGDDDKKQRIGYPLFAVLVGATIGFYDGVFGAAAGSFYTLSFVLLLGFNLTKAVAHAKVLNFTSNLASLIFFILGGAVIWQVGIVMMIGQFIGGTLGARMVVTKGKRLIRPMLVTISFLMVAKMLYDQGFF